MPVSGSQPSGPTSRAESRTAWLTWSEVSRGRGVITDPAIWERVRAEIEQALDAAGCVVSGWTESPITGADGNREFLVHAITPERT